MLFYRALSSNEVQFAFYLEDGFSLEHEYRFRELGGPEQVGANRALIDPISKLDDLLDDESKAEGR